MDKGGSRSFPHRIQGFSYLRSTRMLASFRDELSSARQVDAWLDHLSGEDRRARRSELEKLPEQARDQLLQKTRQVLGARVVAGNDLNAGLDACREVLLARDRDDEERLRSLRSVVTPDDEYSLLRRALGLYPVTALAIKSGIARWHAEVRETFSTPTEQLAVSGELRRYAPAGAARSGQFPVYERDALGIPQPGAAQTQALFRRHAPVWVIDTAGAADLPGRPVWQRGVSAPAVDSSEPVVYRYTSMTRFRGRPRLQLNYLIWFDARPPAGPLDMLAGRLDGVIWRVTLDDAGQPLVYDSVHPCGCYHLLFPVGDVRLRDSASQLPEPPLVPVALKLPAPGTRVHLRLSAGAHYLQRVTYRRADPRLSKYQLAERDALYAIPTDKDGRRSLFQADGLVAGTQRPERWFLWPTGVRSPGAMRERGRRATAFVGRRHFDDPFLLDRIFR